jgi:hypothetical protein
MLSALAEWIPYNKERSVVNTAGEKNTEDVRRCSWGSFDSTKTLIETIGNPWERARSLKEGLKTAIEFVPYTAVSWLAAGLDSVLPSKTAAASIDVDAKIEVQDFLVLPIMAGYSV